MVGPRKVSKVRVEKFTSAGSEISCWGVLSRGKTQSGLCFHRITMAALFKADERGMKGKVE